MSSILRKRCGLVLPQVKAIPFVGCTALEVGDVVVASSSACVEGVRGLAFGHALSNSAIKECGPIDVTHSGPIPGCGLTSYAAIPMRSNIQSAVRMDGNRILS